MAGFEFLTRSFFHSHAPNTSIVNLLADRGDRSYRLSADACPDDVQLQPGTTFLLGSSPASISSLCLLLVSCMQRSRMDKRQAVTSMCNITDHVPPSLRLSRMQVPALGLCGTYFPSIHGR